MALSIGISKWMEEETAKDGGEPARTSLDPAFLFRWMVEIGVQVEGGRRDQAGCKFDPPGRCDHILEGGEKFEVKQDSAPATLSATRRSGKESFGRSDWPERKQWSPQTPSNLPMGVLPQLQLALHFRNKTWRPSGVVRLPYPGSGAYAHRSLGRVPRCKLRNVRLPPTRTGPVAERIPVQRPGGHWLRRWKA